MAILLIPLIVALMWWIYSENKCAHSTRIVSGLTLVIVSIFCYHFFYLFLSSYDKNKVTWVMHHMASKLDELESEDYHKAINRYKDSNYDTNILMNDFKKLKYPQEIESVDTETESK